MKNTIRISVIISILASVLVAQNPKAPSIFFEKTEVNFGQVPPDSLLHYTFKFQNTGTDTLVILNVRPG